MLQIKLFYAIMLYYARCHVLSANTLGKWFCKVLPGSCVIKST